MIMKIRRRNGSILRYWRDVDFSKILGGGHLIRYWEDGKKVRKGEKRQETNRAGKMAGL
jgi:hypothetical protein